MIDQKHLGDAWRVNCGRVTHERVLGPAPQRGYGHIQDLCESSYGGRHERSLYLPYSVLYSTKTEALNEAIRWRKAELFNIESAYHNDLHLMKVGLEGLQSELAEV